MTVMTQFGGFVTMKASAESIPDAREKLSSLPMRESVMRATFQDGCSSVILTGQRRAAS